MRLAFSVFMSSDPLLARQRLYEKALARGAELRA